MASPEGSLLSVVRGMFDSLAPRKKGGAIPASSPTTNPSSHRQYEAQRSAWSAQGRRAEGGTSDDSWRGVVTRALPSPATAAFIITCLLWYFSSALSSNTSKALLSAHKAKHHMHSAAAAAGPAAASPMSASPLSADLSSSMLTPPAHPQLPPAPFPYPVTLTLIQFVSIHLLSSAVASPTIMRHVPGARKPVTRIVPNPGWKRIGDMAKLSVFNVVGHALSTVAISRVPVSTVHTIKALTPLFTVLSFRFLFGVHYSLMAYVSLLPLTLGVMMACTSLSFSANDLLGLWAALASTFIFVAQSIYSKNLVGRPNEHKEGRGGGKGHDAIKDSGKLDKINILYYTSACSVAFMIPMALYYDAPKLFGARAEERRAALAAAAVAVATGAPAAASTLYITWMVIANGVVQFFQNFLAFSVLALVSPVTYSIASLFKRVFVICFAIIWFGQSVSQLQWLGIVLTFVGLYMYNDNKASKSIAKGEAKMEAEERRRDMRLPTTVQGATAMLTASGPSTPRAVTPVATQTAFQHQSQHHSLSQTPRQQLLSLPDGQQHVSVQTQINEGRAALPEGAFALHGFGDFSAAPDHSRSAMAHQPAVASNGHIGADKGTAPGMPVGSLSAQDPRRSIPSPPPSRGPCSEDGTGDEHHVVSHDPSSTFLPRRGA